MVPQRFQSCSKVIPERLQRGSRAIPELFQSGSRAVPEWFQNGSRAVPERLHSGSRGVPERFQSDCRAVPERFQSVSRAFAERLQSGCRAVPDRFHRAHHSDQKRGTKTQTRCWRRLEASTGPEHFAKESQARSENRLRQTLRNGVKRTKQSDRKRETFMTASLQKLHKILCFTRCSHHARV